MRRFVGPLALLLAGLFLAAGCRLPGGGAVAPGAGSSAATAGLASETPATLHVFAAASLTDAFEEIGAGFAAAHAGTELVFNFAGSNQLATQIGEGAPADVFAAANRVQMQAAIDSGRILSGTQQTFARNQLVVVTPSDNPAGITTLADLAKPGIKIVFAAQEVPIGQYALDFLDKAAADPRFGAAYKDAVLANVVSYEENVRSVLAKVALGEADAGIVYTSDAAVNPEEVQQVAIPDALNTIASYPIAVLRNSPHAEQAEAFVAYVRGVEGQAVLEKYGFLVVEE